MNIRRTLIRSIALLLLAVPLTPSVHAQTPAPQPASAILPAWTPDPKLLPSLGPAQKFGPYTLRAPKGYTVKQHILAKPVKGYSEYHVQGPKRADGTSPTLTIVMLPGTSNLPPDDIYLFLRIEHTHFGPYERGKAPIEQGTIGGVPCVRQPFTVHAGHHTPVTYNAYRCTAINTHALIVLTAQDSPSHSAATFPLLQASMLTLHAAP